MNFLLRIDTSKSVIFTNNLEKLRRSALPNAVRNTLNKAAFHTKQVTMPVSAHKHFEKRKPNFFKANSKVFMAKGYDLKTMKAVVGFVPGNAQYNNDAVKELQQQEFSGVIKRRSLIPLNPSRSGGTLSGQVLPSRRVRAIKNVIDAAHSTGRNAKQKFIKAALAAGRGGFVIGNFKKKTLFKIDSIKTVGGRTIIKKTPLYSVDKGRSVRIKKATHFMREATNKSASKIYKFYKEEALRQINRTFKK